MWRLLLVLRCQITLYRRYPDVLQPYKYAGYPLLIEAMPSSSSSGGRHHLGSESGDETMQLTQVWNCLGCSL